MGKERGTVPITQWPSQRNPSLLTAGATLPCRIHCHITLPQKMMQSQKLLGLSIYLPWLQAQMPLDTVSDETNKAINLRHQRKASETKATSRELYFLHKSPVFGSQQSRGARRHLDVQSQRTLRHLHADKERALLFEASPGTLHLFGKLPPQIHHPQGLQSGVFLLFPITPALREPTVRGSQGLFLFKGEGKHILTGLISSCCTF